MGQLTTKTGRIKFFLLLMLLGQLAVSSICAKTATQNDGLKHQEDLGRDSSSLSERNAKIETRDTSASSRFTKLASRNSTKVADGSEQTNLKKSKTIKMEAADQKLPTSLTLNHEEAKSNQIDTKATRSNPSNPKQSSISPRIGAVLSNNGPDDLTLAAGHKKKKYMVIKKKKKKKPKKMKIYIKKKPKKKKKKYIKVKVPVKKMKKKKKVKIIKVHKKKKKHHHHF